MNLTIRPESPADIIAIQNITRAAFAGKPYSDETEHLIINRLRNAQALFLSLVAEIPNEVVGHVAFSSVTINGEDLSWYGLGPISVKPGFQNQGIGSKLVRDGLSLIRENGAQGCVLEGSPIYYQRFGFKSYEKLVYRGAPSPEYFMALPFYEIVPVGVVEFHKGFYSDI